MKVEIRVDPARLRRWTGDLARRLAALPGVTSVGLRLAPARPLPAALDLLIGLDRLVHRLPGERPSDPVAPAGLGLPVDAAEPADLVIDLAGDGAALPRRSLRPLFAGSPDEAALFAALLAGEVPLLEIEDDAGGRAAGRPSVENAAGFAQAYETVVARLGALVEGALTGRPSRASAAQGAARPVAARAVATYAARSLAFAAVRALYRLCCHAPHWRVGWRPVEAGGVWARGSLEGAPWHILADPGIRFFADPFPARWQGRDLVFVEDFDHRTQKGILSVAEVLADGRTGAVRPVLEEPWHLSYPFLFEDEGAMYMIPESSAAKRVVLYRADPFPHRWVPEAVLLDGIEASDATIVRHGGRLWLFATTRDGQGAHSDMLSLFHAPALRGPWTAHPLNPVLIDAAAARPAGNIVVRDGRLWRPVQDCSRGYGRGLGLAEVTRLDEEGFSQAVRTLIRPEDAGWGRRLHTLTTNGFVECVDGAAHSPRWRTAPAAPAPAPTAAPALALPGRG